MSDLLALAMTNESNSVAYHLPMRILTSREMETRPMTVHTTSRRPPVESRGGMSCEDGQRGMACK